MKKLHIYKKGILVGMSVVLIPSMAGCSASEEVVDTKTETVLEDPDWVRDRMPSSEDTSFTQEKIEKAAVAAFESWASNIESAFQSLQDSAMVSSAKKQIAGTFIEMTDILFYGKEFEYSPGKTTTVSELGDMTLQKLQLIYSTVDSKIESYWPGYKEDIENTWNLGKGYIVDKANTLKLYLLNQIENHMDEEDYEKCGEYFRMFQEQSKKDLENGKDLLEELWNQGTDLADEKYKDFKEKYEEKYHK